jgi:hypothetical protein
MITQFSQPIDCKLDMFLTLEQKFVNVMTQHMTKEICNVDNIKSSEIKGVIKKIQCPYLHSY